MFGFNPAVHVSQVGCGYSNHIQQSKKGGSKSKHSFQIKTLTCKPLQTCNLQQIQIGSFLNHW